jgi:hypothetical protein
MWEAAFSRKAREIRAISKLEKWSPGGSTGSPGDLRNNEIDKLLVYFRTIGYHREIVKPETLCPTVLPPARSEAPEAASKGVGPRRILARAQIVVAGKPGRKIRAKALKSLISRKENGA